MRYLAFLLLVLFSVTAYGQKKDTAVGTYAENGKLISITNLTGLSDCSAVSVSGKVGKVKTDGGLARVNIKSGKSNESVEVPLDRLAPDERAVIFKQLLRKSLNIRIAGYRCEPEGPFKAFSIDRVY